MTFLFSNNAQTTLAETLTSTATTLSVASGGGALFPTPSTGKIFAVTITSATNPDEVEICYCSAVSTDTLTISRGKDNTIAQSFSAGDLVSLFPTAGVTSLFAQAGFLGVFSSSVASDIGGYPLNAVVVSDTEPGIFWISTAANNTTTPGATDATWDQFDFSQQYVEQYSDDSTYDVSKIGINKTSGDLVAYSGGVWQSYQPAGDYAKKSEIGQLLGAGGSTTLTVPSWATRFEYTLTGGGGGGSACQATGSSYTSTNVSGGGGGSGATIIGLINVSASSTISVTIGAGGASETDGGSSSIVYAGTTYATAGGGAGASFASTALSAGGAGGIATASGGNPVSGSSGQDGQNGGLTSFGNGAGSYWGGGGRAGAQGGLAGGPYGAGGGGAYDSTFTGTFYNGGAGASGFLLYRWLP